MTPVKTIEIIICDRCTGLGHTIAEAAEGNSLKTRCTQCVGSGRLRKTTTVEVEPYA
jgi:DnaJ-class molecular chaperone